MAQVTLQVVVKRDELNKLQADVNKLNSTKITIDTTPLAKNAQEAEKATQALLKTQQEQSKAAKEAARAEEALAKAEKAQVSVQTEVEKQTKAGYQAQQAKIRLEREAAKQARETAKEEENHSKSLDKQSLAYKILGRSVGEFMLRMTAYRAVYAGIRAITNGFSEALQTLKAVDDELVTVRKVTGFDAAQMAEVESQAYAVASKYGASASDYVSGVAAFARAGYKELSGDLAELAQKTIIVGDTTAEVANQFLLSVDAAYQFHGSVKELSKVLDAANEIDNKYATSIEKIAEGMGIVAPVAAQMHVGVYELEAAIGTITAVTQRTGTEAARALRAIMLNIVGDTKTEIEEGVTWTTGEIAGLKDVIKQYAPEAYKAAQATGSIIDPMKAIGGLAQSMKEGVLTEQKLMEMVSDIGGKLRTSQLLALIQNWDMYNSMLEDTANAAGSADKEIENAMDSWTRKTNVLKNTWTEFVKTSLNSNMFKGALDALTWIVQRLDNLGSVVLRLATIYAGLHAQDIVNRLSKAKDKVVDLFNAVKTGATTAQSAAGIVGIALAAITAAWSAYSFAVEDAKRKHEEQVKAIYEAADAAQDSAKKVVELTAEMSMAESGSDSYKQSIENLASALGTTLPENADEAIKKLRELSSESLRAAAAEANTARLTAEGEFVSASEGSREAVMRSGFGNLGGRYGSDLAAQLEAIKSGISREGRSLYDVSDLESAKNFRAAMQDVVDTFNQYIYETGEAELQNDAFFLAAQQYLAETSNAFSEFEARTKNALDAEAMEIFQRVISTTSVKSQEDLDALISRFKGARTVSEETREKLVELANEYFHFAEATEQSSEALKKETVDLYANQKALDANATSEERAAAAKKDAANAARMLIPYLFDEQNQLTAVGQAALMSDKNLAGLVQAELEAQLAASQANYSSLVAQLATVGITAETTAAQLWAMARAAAGDSPVSGAIMGAIGGAYTGYQGLLKSRMAEIKSLMAQISGISSYSGVAPSWTSSGSSHSGSSHSGGGSGGGSGSSGSGKSSSSSSQTTEDKKLTALKDRVSLLKSELSLMQERGDSEEDQIAKMREIMKAVSAEADYLKSIKGDQVTINNLYQEWYQYHNKIEDLMNKEAEDAEKQAKALQDALDAQRALNNALNNRNVRIYNAATGQWEWTSNPSDVSAAQSKLRDAIANLPADQQSQFAYYLNHTPGGGPMGSTLYDFLPGEVAAALAANTTTPGRGGVNNYGNTYNFGGMTFSQAQANSMTLAQFAQLAGGLSIYNNSP